MSQEVIDVSKEYRAAKRAAAKFNPGKQPDIAELMRISFEHGYAQALLDKRQKEPK